MNVSCRQNVLYALENMDVDGLKLFFEAHGLSSSINMQLSEIHQKRALVSRMKRFLGLNENDQERAEG